MKRNKAYKPKQIESPQEMWRLFQEYVQLVKSNPFLVQDFVGGQGMEVQRKKEKPLTMEGFTNYLWNNDIMRDPKDYFSNKDGRYTDYIPVCTRVKETIRQDQIEGGMAGVYNPSITQRLNGLIEKTDNVHNVNEIVVKHDR